VGRTGLLTHQFLSQQS